MSIAALVLVVVATFIAFANGAARLTLDRLHWLTSGAASFARGLNDVPKMVARERSSAAERSRCPGGSWS